MTPERARDLYYKALGEIYDKYALEWKKPRVQYECEIHAWGIVIEEIRKEAESNLVKEMADKGVFSASYLPEHDESRSDPPR